MTANTAEKYKQKKLSYADSQKLPTHNKIPAKRRETKRTLISTNRAPLMIPIGTRALATMTKLIWHFVTKFPVNVSKTRLRWMRHILQFTPKKTYICYTDHLCGVWRKRKPRSGCADKTTEQSSKAKWTARSVLCAATLMMIILTCSDKKGNELCYAPNEWHHWEHLHLFECVAN